MCVHILMPRCQFAGCFVHNSESWQDDSEFSCCTRRCSYTGGGVLLHLDTLSARGDTQTGRQTVTRSEVSERERERETRSHFAFVVIVVGSVAVVMVTFSLFLIVFIIWTEKQAGSVAVSIEDYVLASGL